ncbi:ATP-binding protein [Akkermansiaceae bacterium]|nr:ATP-binding protein [Akkermansiaceae bacterium]MDA7891490.1 ATP-binding protein [Akkermansiaceae bacterium]MDB4465273.1 ATP-binding protein [Akkermansiaceae bacterium]MDB4509658.1 ATP-binding protein [Akkermansiaceae bacterium]MDF1711817.1 ATP-binding protein [Akkermansiaceae bacterium]
MKRPSIRDRLLAWTTFVITLIMAVAGTLLYNSVKRSLYSQHDLLLNEAATLVLIEVKAKNGKVHHEWKASLDSASRETGKSMIQVWDLESGESVKSAALGESDLERQYGKLGERVFYNVTFPNGEAGRAVGILTYPVVENMEENEGFVPGDHPQVFVWADSTQELRDVLIKTKRAFVAAGVAVVLLSAIAIWLIIYLSSLAVQSFSADLLSREGTEIGEPVPVPDRLPSEVAGMAGKFNALLARIDHYREKDQDFFLNVAHEVRTPLAGVKAVIEQALRRPREVEDYQRRLREALDSTENLVRLTDRLMEFGKLRNARESMVRITLDLNTLLEGVLEKFRSRARERGLRFKGEFCGKAELGTDEELLKIVVNNLVENSVTYAAPNTVIELKTSRTEGMIEFKIQNEYSNPEGLPDDLDVFFDAFYRNDKARDLGVNNIGIGLSFCKEVMLVLGGQITASKSSAHGLCFTVSLPVNGHAVD